jgi:hypothetical protein
LAVGHSKIIKQFKIIISDIYRPTYMVLQIDKIIMDAGIIFELPKDGAKNATRYPDYR